MENINIVNIYITGEIFIYPEQLYNTEEIELNKIDEYNIYFICYINKLRITNVDNKKCTINIIDEYTCKNYLINIKKLKFLTEYLKKNNKLIDKIENDKSNKYVLVKLKNDKNPFTIKIPIYLLIMDRNFNNGIEDTFDFDILYIGQAKGKNKKRNAIERLKKHETLQKISFKENEKNKDLIICLFSCKNTVYTENINPSNILSSKPLTREETIDIAESGLINYFKPEYNEKFKNGFFPSDKLKTHKKLFTNSYYSVLMELDFSNYSMRFKGKNLLNSQDNFLQGMWLKEANGKSFFVNDLIKRSQLLNNNMS